MKKYHFPDLSKLDFIHMPNSSIRAKLTIPYIMLALIIALAGGLVVTKFLLSSLEDRYTNQLIETRKLASELMVREEDRMLGTLRLITHTQGLADTISLDNKDKILELVYPITFNAEEDAVLVLDPEGQVIASIFRNDGTSEYTFPDVSADISQFPFVTKVINQEVDSKGDKYSGISYTDKGTYFFVSGPLKDPNGDLSAIILVGKTLQGITTQIRQETLSQATIYDSDFNPIISTMPDLPPQPGYDPEKVFESNDEESMMRDFDNSNIGYTELLGPWTVRGGEEIGYMGTALPKTFLVRTSNMTKINVTLIFAFAIIAAMLLGLFLSGIITRPILKLKQAAVEVAKGNLEVQVDAEGNDEVAILTNSFNEMVANLNQSEKDLMAAYDKTIEGWSKALELRDRETQGHSFRVTELTIEIARSMNISEEYMPHIRRGALLHDIGKIGIPDAILLKPGPLTYDERCIMERHPLLAREMLKQISFLHPAMEIPSFHHERWDGDGYPYGLAGKEIPVAARIFAIVDVWDALTTDRPYKRAMLRQEAFEIIVKGSGTQFDPNIVNAFIHVIKKKYARRPSEKGKSVRTQESPAHP